jgi:hypothetical protein
MRLIEVVILAGSQCVSPIQGSEGLTEVVKVPCAVLVRHDAATDEVEILPPGAATDPQVIAVLVKPSAPAAAAAPAETIVPVSAPETITPEKVEKKSQARAPAAEPAPRKKRAERRSAERKPPDRCGSYRAVWYTAKNGHKRYRCVKAG